jgi:hypothetical protein
MVHLPNFDHDILDRVTSDVEDAADHMHDLAHRRRERVIDDD